MHKYHIADILTSIEFLMAAAIIALTISSEDAGWVLIAFAVGELCDAFDGICARRWHYPNDGKRRFWRIHAALIDQISDIVLGLAVLAYLVIVKYSDSLLLLSLVILVTAISIQFMVNDMERKGDQETADRLVLFRRHLYIAGLAFVGLLLIYFASWPLLVKEIIAGLGVITGIVLWIVKADRRTQNHTPL